MDSALKSMTKEVTQAASAVVTKLELAVIPVSDPDLSKMFYTSLGWRLDIDFQGDDYRVIQFTPPGSDCSVMFGRNITTAPAGSSRGLHLVVSDIEAARKDLTFRGVETSEPFHDVGGVFHHSNGLGITTGVNPERKSYASYLAFQDPDGNEWTVQEITTRLPGRPGDKAFTDQLTKAVWGAN
ncbi:catechol 2,3-dioxygenase-like lactoylglutathione lyase family enzyme [Pararhizobium capsulatum DSM 1112]|uniref:Catechol 2,3-dioxygenase-like lactoylglutathione lyase family enzyme n=1 Tax=Pararhizobium capsulatum DSM 1112 TaxID=1121113 RepID=A0ABU0C070_9HYPH|nr:VOC family protein [Pararhizobium capsulatum]MDQ0323911.1 catechol 2,3-dioxygenase-like lactoylglutathione lyase family enzyme [Pararhizobium capsulatum DSM 1112]